MGRGRAPKGEYAGKTEVMSFRLTPDTKAALRRAAATSGRSLSQEAEHRLRRGLDEEEAISKLWGDVKTSAMLRLAAQVVQSLGTMRDTKVHWTADAKVFDSAIEAGQVPDPIAVARFCTLDPANHSACALVAVRFAFSVRAVNPVEQLPAVDATVEV